MLSDSPGDGMAWLMLGLLVLRLMMFRSKQSLAIACGIVLISLGILRFHQLTNASEFDAASAAEPKTVLLEIDPNRMRINGDLLSGDATLRWHGAEEKVVYYYKLKSEEEKIQWEQSAVPQKLIAKVAFEKPEGERNLFQFDYADYLEQKKVHWIVNIQAIEHREEDRSVWKAVSILRRKIILLLEKLPSPKAADYIQTMLFNQQHTIAAEALDNYREIGLLHLFSISGMHIQLLLVQIGYILLRLQVTHETTNKLLVVFLIGYGLLTGWGVGIFRAICTHFILLIGRIFHQQPAAKDAFAITILLAVWMNPATIYTAGFQLSYLLSGVLYFIAPACSDWKMQPVLKDILLTLIMTVVSFPILSYHFFEVSWMGVFVNVVFSFCFSWVLFPLFWVLFSALLFFPGTELLRLFAGVTDAVLTVLEDFSGWCGDFRLFRTVTGRPDMLYFVMVGFFILILLVRIEQNRRGYKAFVGTALAILIFSSSARLNPYGKVVMLDVGQGDSFLVITPYQRQTLLIDTGGTVAFEKEEWQIRDETATAGKKLLSAIKAEGVKKLDKVFLTHADSDHVGSLLELSQGIKVDEIYFPKGTEQNEELKEVLLTLQKDDARLYPIIGKQDIIIDADLTFRVLAPLEEGDGGNEDSLVIFTEIASFSWLFTGDLGEAGEKGLLAAYPLLEADVLKIGHHGSSSSSSELLLDRLKPRIALISAGDNNAYGHPDAAVLDRLYGRNIRIFRTDQQGAVHFTYGPGKPEWQTIMTNQKFE